MVNVRVSDSNSPRWSSVRLRYSLTHPDTDLDTELVLATLTEHFDFAPGPEVFWAMGNVQLPFLKNKESQSIQMPLKVTIAE